MIGEVIIENGQKKIVALTADTGTGAPVGSYLYMEKKSNPSGYLYCDGSTFDETKYPALYQYLGTNVLPDWRELGAKGAEKNTTLIFDSTETDPTTGQAGTQNHDVFAQGEFKDDQVQGHTHTSLANSIWSGIFNNEQSFSAGGSANFEATLIGDPKPNAETNYGRIAQYTNGIPRAGDVTRGKSRAVFIYIKATSGLTENQQENVLNTINENLSYSTEEHFTGRYWYNGKKIYEKTYNLTDIVTDGRTYSFDVISLHIDEVIKYEGYINRTVQSGSDLVVIQYDWNFWDVNNTWGCLFRQKSSSQDVVLYRANIQDSITTTGVISLFYTKTTD